MGRDGADEPPGCVHQAQSLTANFHSRADVEAQAAAVAPLLGGASPQEFLAWPAEQQAAQLASLPGTGVMASLYQLPAAGGSPVCAERSGVRMACAILRLEEWI
jgi:hypothetical protein